MDIDKQERFNHAIWQLSNLRNQIAAITQLLHQTLIEANYCIDDIEIRINRMHKATDESQ